MKFIIERKHLLPKLGLLQGIVERHATIPVLSNFYLETTECVGDEGHTCLQIVGTDLDTTLIINDVPAQIEQRGKACLPAKKLFEIVKSLPEGFITFTLDTNCWMKITGGRSNFRLAAMHPDTFPEFADAPPSPEKLLIPAKLLRSFIQNTSFAITTEQSRFTFAGAKLIAASGCAEMITTDGHRLAYLKHESDEIKTGSGFQLDALIPKKSLMELAKILKEKADESPVVIRTDLNNLFFEIESEKLVARKLNGNFPAWQSVIPTGTAENVVKCDASHLKLALQRVTLMADERKLAVNFKIHGGELELAASDGVDGEGRECVEAEFFGNAFEIAFNWRFVQDFLDHCRASLSSDGGGLIRFETYGQNRGVIFRPESNPQMIYVVMPLRW